MSKHQTPSHGDVVEFDNAPDSHIEVGSVTPEQPLADEGIFVFDDQYGDTKLCALDGDRWVVVMDHELTPEQSDAVHRLLNPGTDHGM